MTIDKRNMDKLTMDRRTLLRGFGALGALTFASRSGLGASLQVAPGLRPDTGSGTLVMLQLSGGNDGLSMIVPHGDDAYHAARPTIAHKATDVHEIDKYRGFNPNLSALAERYKTGEVAIIEGCGYADPSKSHFKSMEIWHAADKRGNAAGEGWIGRLSNAAWEKSKDPNRVVHVGASTPFSLESEQHPAASFVFPEGYRWLGNEGGAGSYEEQDGTPKDSGSGSTLDALRGAYSAARESSSAVRKAALAYRPRVEYPRSAIGQALGTAAALIQGGIGSRVISVELNGFDTHNKQLTRHNIVMADLDEALAAFHADLKGTARGDDTTLMAFSEFGRRVAENGSKGTDHGTAGPMLVLGKNVTGGIYGEHPSLTKLNKGNLIYTTDFRQVYAEVAEALFHVKSKALFGKQYKHLGFLPS
ncbi:MAG: hypothetical protein ACI8Q9_001413 [Planctomycetota bacterium]|jgi:uncharacterized protein (DUF1501 family)